MSRRWWMAGLLVVALLAGLALACDMGGAKTPGATPAKGETPEAVETPEEAVETPEEVVETPEVAETPEEVLPFEMDETALNNLDSYAYTVEFSGSGVTEGELQSGSLTADGQIQNAPTKAMHVIWKSTSDSEETYMEWVYIEDEGKAWMLSEEGGEWTEIPATDPSIVSSFESLTFLGVWTSFASMAEGTTLVGTEDVNGIATRHYHAGEFSGLGTECTVGSAEQDWWVAIDGNYPMKGTIDAEATCAGESGEFHLSEEISDVNQPQDIQPPL